MNNSDELKPCPFCGSENIHLYNSHAAKYRQYTVKCKKCGARMMKSTIAESILAWNKRDVKVAKVRNQSEVRVSISSDFGYSGHCGNCDYFVYDAYDYCPCCGYRLEWE